jgi:hypothetical protein
MLLANAGFGVHGCSLSTPLKKIFVFAFCFCFFFFLFLFAFSFRLFFSPWAFVPTENHVQMCPNKCHLIFCLQTSFTIK